MPATSDTKAVEQRIEEVPPGPRAYRSAWIHDRLLTAEEWLAEEAHVLGQMEDMDDPEDDAPSTAGVMVAIAKEIQRLRQAVALHAADATRNAEQLASIPAQIKAAVQAEREAWSDVRRIGAQLSNIAYNLSHAGKDRVVTEHERKVLAVCASDWDAAIRARGEVK